MRDYTKIVAWQRADDLAVAVYCATNALPAHEVFSLTNQLRRAAYSVPANIVEGCSRPSNKDYLHFLHVALGSLAETQYFIHLAERLGYLKETQVTPLKSQTKATFASLHGLIKAVKAQIPGPARRPAVL